MRDLRRECRAWNLRGLTERDEDLVARLILPAVAHGQREFLADIVELSLREQLHIRREIDDEVRREEVDVDRTRRKVNGSVDIMRLELEQGIRPIIDLKIDD